MTRALDVYLLSYDGLSSWTCGVGTGTYNFVSAMPHVAELLRGRFDCSFHVVGPPYTAALPGFDGELLRRTTDIVEGLAGTVLAHPDGTNGSRQFGPPQQWHCTTVGAAEVVQGLLRPDAKSVVFATDTPYAGVGERLARSAHPNLATVWTPHSTVRNHGLPDEGGAREDWERRGIAAATAHERCFTGAINGFMRQHLISAYGAAPAKVVALANGLPLHEAPGPVADTGNVLRRVSLDPSRRYVVACGRAEGYKGFRELIRAFRVSQDNHDCDLLLVLSELTKQDPILDECRALLADLGVRGRIVADFLPQPELRALLRHPAVKVFAVPSLADPASILPAEVRWWCETAGPVLVVSDRDGFRESVRNGVDGFRADVTNPEAFGSALTQAVRLGPTERAALHAQGRTALFADYDYARNIADCLRTVTDRMDALGASC